MRSCISVWGPSAWNFLHTISFSFPVLPTEEERKDMEQFLLSFSKVIPCAKCRDHFSEMLQSSMHNHVFSSRETLSRFLVHLHNKVNQRIGKKAVDYDWVVSVYTTKKEERIARFEKVSLVILLLVLSYFSFLARRKRAGR